MSYVGLGSRWKDASLDTTGDNTGNWTTIFNPDDIAVKVPWFELYRGVASNVPPGTILTVRVGIQLISAVELGQIGEWDPTQPPLLQPAQELRFYWSAQAMGTPPRMTIWLRYDIDEWGKAT